MCTCGSVPLCQSRRCFFLLKHACVCICIYAHAEIGIVVVQLRLNRNASSMRAYMQVPPPSLCAALSTHVYCLGRWTLMFRAQNRCKDPTHWWLTDRQTDRYKGQPSGPAVAPLQPSERLQNLPVPVAAGVRPGLSDGTKWMARWATQVPAWSYSGRRVEEEAPAGPGGDPTGTLILSTVAKGLVVSGIIQRRGRFR